jgi:hypothetical protein
MVVTSPRSDRERDKKTKFQEANKELVVLSNNNNFRCKAGLPACTTAYFTPIRSSILLHILLTLLPNHDGEERAKQWAHGARM